jgi:hypothetical protein
MPRIVPLIAAAALAVSCGSRPQKSGSLSVSAGVGPTTAAASASPSALPAGLVLTELSVAVRKLELEGGVCSGASTDGATLPASTASVESGEDCEAEVGPFVAHLDQAALADLLAGKTPVVWTIPVPAGTYSSLEASVCATGPSELRDEDQAVLAQVMDGASVVLKGTYQAPSSELPPAEFTITVTACAEIERHVNVTVDAAGMATGLVLQASVASWFYDASGAFIPPDTAAGAAAIAANIAASLDVHGEADHDGQG